MKKYPDENNTSGKDRAFFQPGFSTFLNDDDLIDGDINGFDEEVSKEPDAIDEEDKESIEKNGNRREEDRKAEDSSGEHDGKYFVVQRGMACCEKGTKFPHFKVTSHQKHYWNDEKGEADYLAVTENDLTFNPAAIPFGTCSIKNGNPCAYSPAGKWTKTYEKVKVMGKSAVTERSELMCTTGGKITVMKHGQQSEAGKSHVNNADSREQQTYNPVMDFEEFKEEINESDQLYYE
jgi:hypothetical protein